MSLATAEDQAPSPLPFLGKIPGILGKGQVDRATGVLPVHFGTLDEALPDGGLPRGAVVELATPYGLARSTSIALSACASAQAEAKLQGEASTQGAWCAWIEPSVGGVSPLSTSLFAPAVEQAGIDLSRFLVIRPPAEALSRVAVRTVASRVFSVVVIDLVGVPGHLHASGPKPGGGRLDQWLNPVRRLALAVEDLETTVLLLTDSLSARSLPLPVAMRLELERMGDRLSLTIAKDRRGRVAPAQSIVVPRPFVREAPAPARPALEMGKPFLRGCR